ncbi:MAG: prepilin-type N-terminal cleavage/methylation domain-containing protein [Gammaproteobacteria bacterium]|nr:prepilin-type N-terminal cleavage/methylation domain-containing protein [Gammaproteobacteria bacterium]
MRARGFTLIELMIVVVIIGILASIAYPGYTTFMTQGRRSDAHTALLRITDVQEKFFTRCNSYASSLTATRDCANLGLGMTQLSPDHHYFLSLITGVVQSGGAIASNCSTINCGFTAIANPSGTGVTGRQPASDGCFGITSKGDKFFDKNCDGDYNDANDRSKWAN